MFLKFWMRQIVSFLSSLDCDAKNLPKGSKVSPLALASRIWTGAALVKLLILLKLTMFVHVPDANCRVCRAACKVQTIGAPCHVRYSYRKILVKRRGTYFHDGLYSA